MQDDWLRKGTEIVKKYKVFDRIDGTDSDLHSNQRMLHRKIILITRCVFVDAYSSIFTLVFKSYVFNFLNYQAKATNV